MNSRISDVKIVYRYKDSAEIYNVYKVTFTIDKEANKTPIPAIRNMNCAATDELHAFKLFTEFVNKTYPQRENHEHSI